MNPISYTLQMITGRAPRRHFHHAFYRFAGALAVAGSITGCAATSEAESTIPAAVPAEVVAAESPVGRIDPAIIYYVGAAEILGQREQFRESAEFYRQAAVLSEDPEIAARALRVAAFANDEELTLAGVERWLELDPSNREPHRYAAILYLRQGDAEAAAPHIEALLAAMDPVEAWKDVGQILAQSPNRRAARDALARILSTQTVPLNAEVLEQFSDLAVQNGLLGAAEELTTAAIELDPERADAWAWRGRIRHSQGRVEEARADFARAVQLDPGNGPLRQSFAALLGELEEYEEALAQLDLVDDTVSVVYSKALYAQALEDRERALGYFRILETLDAEDESRKAFLLGQLAETLEMPSDEVLKHYRAVTSGEFLDNAKLRSAVVLARNEQLPQARVVLQKLQNGSAQTAARAFQAEAALLRDADDAGEAMVVYDRALTLLPDNPDLLFARALHAESIDQVEVAESDLRRILTLQPDDPNALNALGYTLADRTDRYDEALSYIERAYAQLPDEPAVIDSMGWIYYKLGDLDKALEYLELAAELAQDPEIAAHLGEVLWALGREDDAKAVWDEALEADAEAEPVLEARDRLLGE